jgi:hypothetical protein
MTQKTAIPTEGRIFVAQLTRTLAAHQATGANLLSPGAKTWESAFKTFAVAISKAKGPRQAAKMIEDARRRLIPAHKDSACFINGFDSRSRSAGIEVLTYEVAKHPLTQTGYEGIEVRAYDTLLRRKGNIRLGLSTLAFISWHALARMHQRSGMDIFNAGGVVACCGLAGRLMRQSALHLNTEINLVNGAINCTGVLRAATKDDGLGYVFYDVLTALEVDEEGRTPKINQGRAVLEDLRISRIQR